MSPPWLNTRSTAALVAGTDNTVTIQFIEVTFVFSPKFETVFTGPLLTTQVQVGLHCHLCFC